MESSSSWSLLTPFLNWISPHNVWLSISLTNFFLSFFLTNPFISLYLNSMSNPRVCFFFLILLDAHLCDSRLCKKYLYKLLSFCWGILNINSFSNHLLIPREYMCNEQYKHADTSGWKKTRQNKNLRLFCHIQTPYLRSGWSWRKNWTFQMSTA